MTAQPEWYNEPTFSVVPERDEKKGAKSKYNIRFADIISDFPGMANGFLQNEAGGGHFVVALSPAFSVYWNHSMTTERNAAMNSQQIRYFLSAARHLNFTKAAEEFYTSQPTVSRQIAMLEEELGFSLFYREGKQLRLTPGGLVMLSEFTQQEAALKSAIQRVEQIQSGFEGKLNVGFLSSFDTDYYIYPPSLAFAERYPGITINMDGASFAPLRQRLYDGEYDIIFTYDFELPYMQNVLSQPVYRTGCALFVSSHHPLAQKENLTAADLRGQTMIEPFSYHAEGWAVEIFEMLARGFGCTSDDFNSIKIRIADTLESKQFLIRAGAGLGITGSCANYVYDSRYTLFPVPGETLVIHAVWRKDNLNPAIPLYLQVLSETPEIDVFAGQSKLPE